MTYTDIYNMGLVEFQKYIISTVKSKGIVTLNCTMRDYVRNIVRMCAESDDEFYRCSGSKIFETKSKISYFSFCKKSKDSKDRDLYLILPGSFTTHRNIKSVYSIRFKDGLAKLLLGGIYTNPMYITVAVKNTTGTNANKEFMSKITKVSKCETFEDYINKMNRLERDYKMADTSFIKLADTDDIKIKQGNVELYIMNNEIYTDEDSYDSIKEASLKFGVSSNLTSWTVMEAESYSEYVGKNLQELCDFLNDEKEQLITEETPVESIAEPEEKETEIRNKVSACVDKINEELDMLEKTNLVSKPELSKLKLLLNEVDSLRDVLLDNEDKLCIKLDEINKEVSNISESILYAVAEIKKLLDKEGNKVEADKETRVAKSKKLVYTYKFEDVVRLEDGITLKTLKTLMKVKGAILIKGAPGSGKTTAMEHFAKTIVAEQNGTEEQIEFVQFSSSYSYTHIIDGLVSVDGIWVIKDGTLKALCKKAYENPDKQYFYLIDEINRADTESVIGELLNCIERRGLWITTKNGNKMIVPKNVCIVATMNEFDSGTKKLDSATLSRFAIVKMNAVDMDAEFILKKKGIWETASEELKNLINTVISDLTEINGFLETSEYLGKENMVGFRDLFTEYDTVEELKLIVKHSIIETIDGNIYKLSEHYRETAQGKLDEMVEKLKL